MEQINSLFDKKPFSMKKDEKNSFFNDYIFKLTRYHYDHCIEYRKILDIQEFDVEKKYDVENMPFLPVRIFKEHELSSVKKDEIIKTMTSSGTSGQQVSKIFLDKNNAANQTKVLTSIISEFIGSKRLPMLIIDSRKVLKDRKSFSARGAGILGFSIFGKDTTYALDENMNIDYNTVESFCKRHIGKDILVFGFTFMIWKYFINELYKKNKKLSLGKGIIIHGGGWKKLLDQKVDNDHFKAKIKKFTGINKVHNYYGMVEQTGSIYFECEKGYFHCSNFSDIIIRNNDFSVCNKNERGLIELISLLPTSYPGHIILSEDVGEIIGEDYCKCGRHGKYFKVHGRAKKAEIRGCSDTHE